MVSHRRKPQSLWVLAGAVLLATSCSEGQQATQASAPDEPVAELQQSLTSTEAAQVTLLVNDMRFFSPDFRVRPILNCIDKLSDTQFIAHFGYDNTTSGTQTYNLGPLNRFFPDPQGRGQPTVLSKGTWKDQVQVPFNGNLVIWGLDGNAAFANKQSPLCKVVPPKCPVSCDDHNPCTADLCDSTTGFRCIHKPMPNGVSCGDGNACNGDEVCRDGACRAGKPPVCADGNPCTANICDPRRGCVFVPKPDGTSCPVPGNCGAGGSCKTGVCQARTPNCDDHNPCTADSCGPNNSCTHTPLPVGTACSDGNFCNGAEVCNAKAQCKAPSRPDCDDHNPCTVDACKVTGGCSHVPGHDGRKCTTSSGAAGKCDTGICQPTNVQCPDDGNACTDEVIDPATGACTHPPKVDDTPCNDGNLCTQLDVCKSGVCTGTTPVVCSGSTACRSAGTCNPTTGLCQSGTPVADGTTCDDNNLCTSGDACKAGQCVGAPTVCQGDQCHSAGTCDPTTGVCFNPNVNNGTPCNDGVKCTGTDVCTDGVCGGDPVVCKASDGCHDAGTCDEASGACSNPPSPDGKSCNDGNACTQTDTCQAGVCSGANPVVCTGQTACTVDACDPHSGVCTPNNKPDGTGCDDGKKCTSGDVCKSGVCGGATVTCPAPADGCHVQGTCDEASGQCTNPAAPDGTACSDGVNCTTGDVCNAGVCGGAPVVCPVPTDPCHVQGLCVEATGQCTTPTAPDGTACNDGLKCTSGDSCKSGLCGGTPVACPAPAACHLQGTCQESTGTCSTPVAPDGTACNDGNACTQTDSCVSGACAGSNPVRCAPESQCMFGGVCNPTTGACSGTKAKPDGTACNDGLACTTPDTCSAGSCSGKPITCPDGQTCNDRSGSCETLGPCESCEQQHVASGECDPKIGCANITTGDADVALCQAVRDCFLTTGCWAKDPMDCLCGTASGTDCLTSANGACLDVIEKAVKDTDLTNVATLFYNFQVPAGFATQQFACDRDFCSASSTPPSTACPVAVCPDDGNPCTKEVVVNNVCTHQPLADGSACNDGNACTQTDTCQAGACVGSNPVVCGGGGACTTAGSCDTTSGICVGGTNLPDGTTCNDGKKCTTGDVCTGGVCGGTQVSCQPTDACHLAGTCSEATGACTAGPAAPDGTACDDGNKCTTTDVCTAGACGGSAVQCSTGKCDPADGTCKLSVCEQCQQNGIDQGLCDPQIGCQHITTGAADIALCVALRDCMLSTHCAVNDPFDCFCGTAAGTACLTGANGVCKQQTLDATKAGTNLTDAGTRFFDFAFPSGFATQQIACEHDFCGPTADPPFTNACPL